jgi:hypothetical protein
MYFQTLDDKTECVGIYKDGRLHFHEIPGGLERTWRPGGFIADAGIDYAWLICEGKSLDEVCPEHLQGEYEASRRKMSAFYKSFQIAKIDFDEHCIFDLIPEDSLIRFCEIKNQITEHVFETCEKPENYQFMCDMAKLTQKIRHQKLNIDISNSKALFTRTMNRNELQRILNGVTYIDYNIYGTVTGRLTTNRTSFPILTMKKDLRRIINPHNDWFLSLDYNGAEVRTLLALSGEVQPQVDIHDWNCHHLFEAGTSREEAKTRFFAWLYDPISIDIKTGVYDKEGILKKYYNGDSVKTPFGRDIKVEQRKALNYLIQSTTSDTVIERAVTIDKLLADKKSFISHIVHDELVLDLADEDREMIPEIKEVFANNKLDKFMVNLKVGKNYFELEDLNL